VEREKIEVALSPSAQRNLKGLDFPTAIPIAQDTSKYLAVFPPPFGKTRLRKISGFNPPFKFFLFCSMNPIRRSPSTHE
jgi:hypothetical protein